MLKTIASGTIQSVQVLCELNGKPYNVNINEVAANAYYPVGIDNSASINVTVNLETGKTSTSFNNVESLDDVILVAGSLTNQIKAVVAELVAV